MANVRNALEPVADRIPWRRRSARRTLMTAARRLMPWTPRTLGVDIATRRYLLYVVLPLWLGAGFADYVFHRRTTIEQTSGTRESLTHSLMMTETGIPLLMGLFFETNALVLLISTAMFVAHEATAYWDVNYAETRRTVTPNEQHTHSALEMIPFMALSMTACLNWDQALALAGKGPQRPDFRLRPRRPPTSARYMAGILAAVGLLGALPYAEEFIRCFLTKPTLAPTPQVTDEAAGNLPVEAGAQAG